MKNIKVKAGEIAEMRVGATLRSPIRERPRNFSYEALQEKEKAAQGPSFRPVLASYVVMKDVKADLGSIHIRPWDTLSSDERLDKPVNRVATLKSGDIVFRSRGETTSAAVVSKTSEKAVLVSPLVRIRITDDSLILPRYLCWYINQPRAQNFFRRYSEGSSLKMVTLRQLKELPVILPTIAIQKKLISLHTLQIREERLSRNISSKRAKLAAGVFHKILEKDNVQKVRKKMNNNSELTNQAINRLQIMIDRASEEVSKMTCKYNGHVSELVIDAFDEKGNLLFISSHGCDEDQAREICADAQRQGLPLEDLQEISEEEATND